MADDIVQRLRVVAFNATSIVWPPMSEVATEAADEIERLRDGAVERLMRETLFTGMVPTDRGVEMGLQGGAAHLLAESLAESFREGKGINYVEIRFESRQAVPGERFLVTVQRTAGKTPHELRVEAEAALAAAQKNEARYLRLRENWIDCEELGLHGRLSVVDAAADAARTPGNA